MTHKLFFHILKQSRNRKNIVPEYGQWKRWMLYHAKDLTPDDLIRLANHPQNQSYQLSPVHIALLSAQAQALPYLQEDLKCLDYQGNSATLYATLLGDLKGLRYLSEQQIHLHTPNDRRHTPLQTAIRLGAKNALKILLQAHTNPNDAGNYDPKPLKIALIHKRYDLFDDLVRAGADVRYTHFLTERTWLHEACLLDNYPLIHSLIQKYGISPHQPDHKGDLPHHLAAQEGQLNSLKELQAAGANLQLPDAQGWTALDRAVMKRHLPTVVYLLGQGVRLGQNQKGERIFDLLPDPLPVGIEALLFEVLNPKYWDDPMQLGASWYAWQPTRPDLQKLKLELLPRARNTLFALQDRRKATRQIAKDFIALRKSETHG